jgi:hypothetical protein
MKRVTITVLAVIFLVAQAAVAYSETYTLKELTGDDAPDTRIGWVEDIDLDRGKIVMGDQRFRFTKETLYLSTEDEPTDRYSFTKDMAVRYLLEGKHILAIWHVNDYENEYRPKPQNAGARQGPKEFQPAVSNPSELDGEIKKENGVWTN